MKFESNELFIVVKFEPHITREEALEIGREICEEFNEIAVIALHRAPDPNQSTLTLGDRIKQN